MRMMFYCEGGNDASRAAEKFLHNSTQFLQIPMKRLYQGDGASEVGEAERGKRVKESEAERMTDVNGGQGRWKGGGE